MNPIAKLIEYRWIRPDGTVLYKAAFSDHMEFRLGPQTVLDLIHEPAVLVQCRELGGEWKAMGPVEPGGSTWVGNAPWTTP
jgi:hypothetical protein